MTDLKLIALDEEDLNVISAHVQDAVLKVGDMAWLPRERRFVALINRFDWAAVASGAGRQGLRRRRTALRFERVRSARIQGFDLGAKQQVLSLLAIQFEAGAAPAGAVTLVFSGAAAVRLEVECIEAGLSDLGAAWRAKGRPVHPDADDGSG